MSHYNCEEAPSSGVPDPCLPIPGDEGGPSEDWPDDPMRGGRTGYDRSLPSAYSELHGDVRKGQKPRTERD